MLILPDKNKKEQKYPIDQVDDINNYSEDIIAVAKRYLEPVKPNKKPEYLYTKWGVYEMPDPYTLMLKKGPRSDLKAVKM